MLSKVSVDEVFMHYIDKMLSGALGLFGQLTDWSFKCRVCV